MIKFLILAILGVSKSRHYSLTIQWHHPYCWTLNPTYLPKNRYGLLKTDKTAFQLIRAKTKLARTWLCYPEGYSREGAYLLTKIEKVWLKPNGSVWSNQKIYRQKDYTLQYSFLIKVLHFNLWTIKCCLNLISDPPGKTNQNCVNTLLNPDNYWRRWKRTCFLEQHLAFISFFGH